MIILQDIKTLEPDQLKERLDAMNDYLKELDCAVEDANDEDYSDILAELEEDEGEEVLESLPSVPTTIIEKESSPEKEEEKVETRVAVMEEQLFFVCFLFFFFSINRRFFCCLNIRDRTKEKVPYYIVSQYRVRTTTNRMS